VPPVSEARKLRLLAENTLHLREAHPLVLRARGHHCHAQASRSLREPGVVADHGAQVISGGERGGEVNRVERP
jgi:hypothetical protein